VFEALNARCRALRNERRTKGFSMTTQPNQRPTLIWHKSSRSAGSGECVEVAQRESSVLVRDSGDPSRTALVLTAGQWRGLIKRIKQDEAPQR
jgi:hypothetical protein